MRRPLFDQSRKGQQQEASQCFEVSNKTGAELVALDDIYVIK
jgi:hypothetical protein